MEGKSKDSLETQMNSFLKSEVQVIWPEGWMSMAVLQKLCNNYCDLKKSLSPTNRNNSNTNTSENSFINSTSTITTATSSSQNLQQSVTSNTTITTATIKSDIPVLPSNSSLSITPVFTTSNGINSENKIKSPPSNESHTSEDLFKKSLPIEISKKPSSLTIIPTENLTKPHNSHKVAEHLDDFSIQATNITPVKKNTDISLISDTSGSKIDNNHCQVIDLTDHTNKKSDKVSVKYYEDIEAVLKPKEIIDKTKIKTEIEKHRSKSHKEDKQSVSMLNHRMSEYSDNKFAQNLKQNTAQASSANKMTDHSIRKLSSPTYTSSSLDYSKCKSSNERDDIQKVMEGLKVLQKMSSPIKTNDTTSSSPVSVIAFNKNYLSKTSSSSESLPPPHSASLPPFRNEYKGDFGPGFQEAFQRQIFNENYILSNSLASPQQTSSKGHYNNRFS